MTKQINQKDLKKIRKFFHKKQNKTCPVLKMKFKTEDMVCDHAHSANAKNLNKPEEAGLIRGVIHRQANTVEGKVTNSYIRCGLHKFDITLPEFLRNLADFIENPPLIHLKYNHPSEKPKEKRLKKTSITKLEKLFVKNYPNRKIPSCFEYKGKDAKKGKKMTKTLKRFYEEFDVEPSYLKGK
jgi:hypothetical protein